MFLFLLEGVLMYETVEVDGYGKVVLGKDMACPRTHHRGWGTACKTLTLKEDGLYYCEDCGLVYLNRRERYPKMEKTVLTEECACTVLKEVIEWWFDECLGYDCPSSRCACVTCGRHYITPPIAGLKKQQTEGGKKYVAGEIAYMKAERAEKLDSIRSQVTDLVEALEEVTPKERRKLLKPLCS